MKHLLLCGGHVIDPANHLSEPLDVEIDDGKIVAVGRSLSPDHALAIDVSGMIVTPGLIDMHCHCYPTFPFAADSLPTIHPDAHMPRCGVTTAVDAGTCGWVDFPRFKRDVIDRAKTRVLAFLNISDTGMVHMTGEDNPQTFHPALTAEVARAFPGTIVGIKSAHYWVHKPFDELHPPWASIDAMVRAADSSGLPCMADMQPTHPGRSYPDLLLSHLRPGDIHTHMYAPQFDVLREGKVSDFLFEARNRGIRFDLGHGAGSLVFRHAIPAVAQGFLPDTLSTDLYMDNVNGPVLGLTHIMSKFLCMGLSVESVIAKVTCAPAEVLRLSGLGTLSPGSCADVTVLKHIHESVGYLDAEGTRMAGSERIECRMTIRAGDVLYDPYGFCAAHLYLI